MNLHGSRSEAYFVHVDGGGVLLEGALAVPADARGLVILAHPSGTAGHSSCLAIAKTLRERAGLATLVVDLLSVAEAAVDVVTAQHRFDVALLTRRLDAFYTFSRREPNLRDLPLALYGAATAAAATIAIAAARPVEVRAVVLRSGRPDLAGPASLAGVRAPTLFLVGEEDHVVAELNRRARAAMLPTVKSTLQIVPGGGHLFEEPGKLVEVSRHAARWLAQHLPAPALDLATEEAGAGVAWHR